MKKNSLRKQFGFLPPEYNFSLNPYPELRFSKCPGCHKNTGQRKLPLLIHVDPKDFIALNYTCRYCCHCDTLIGHKHEIENHLTKMFLIIKPEIIGNNYLIIGTIEKKAWHKNWNQSKPLNETLQNVHDYKKYEELRMTMGGWFLKGQTPPVMKPPPSTEWKKK